MQQFDRTPTWRTPANRNADPKRRGGSRPLDHKARMGGRPVAPHSPCEILEKLARTIQLMRLGHGDAHLYRNGCDALVQQAIGASKWMGLPPALTQIMRYVEQGDYHWALMELRTISQPEWHTC
ncbi:MAG: hypothetical protein AB7S71_06845 [Dongiaceae bacterium]